jgi:hypothetical protein
MILSMFQPSTRENLWVENVVSSTFNNSDERTVYGRSQPSSRSKTQSSQRRNDLKSLAAPVSKSPDFTTSTNVRNPQPQPSPNSDAMVTPSRNVAAPLIPVAGSPTTSENTTESHASYGISSGTAVVISLSSNSSCTNHTSNNATDTLLPAPIPPIWTPAYPGSGSDLFLGLTAAWTGYQSGTIYDGLNCSAAVTCKTHWPALHNYPSSAVAGMHAQEAWMLLRNPLRSIPSHFNNIRESRLGQADHSIQAPQANWERWRDQTFTRRLAGWAQMISSWYGKIPRVPTTRVSLLIPYEALTDEKTGPAVVGQIREHLVAAGYRNVSPWTTMTSHWHRLVFEQPRVKRQGRGYTPQFEVRQLDHMRLVLTNLRRKHQNQADLWLWLGRYLEEINTLLLVAGDNSTLSSQ